MIAEEVTVAGNNTRRSELVPYVNGITVGVIAPKRSRVSAAEGIRQALANQECLLRRSAEAWELLTAFPATGTFISAARQLVELRDRSRVSDGEPLELAGCGTKTQDHDLGPNPMGEPPCRLSLARRRASIVICRSVGPVANCPPLDPSRLQGPSRLSGTSTAARSFGGRRARRPIVQLFNRDGFIGDVSQFLRIDETQTRPCCHSCAACSFPSSFSSAGMAIRVSSGRVWGLLCSVGRRLAIRSAHTPGPLPESGDGRPPPDVHGGLQLAPKSGSRFKSHRPAPAFRLEPMRQSDPPAGRPRADRGRHHLASGVLFRGALPLTDHVSLMAGAGCTRDPRRRHTHTPGRNVQISGLAIRLGQLQLRLALPSQRPRAGRPYFS